MENANLLRARAAEKEASELKKQVNAITSEKIKLLEDKDS